MKTMLFSGRFDRPHIGHSITFARLAQRYDQVIIVILDYKEQAFPIVERLETISNMLLGLKGSFQVIVSPYHFGEITKEQLDEFPPFDVYGGGNKEVLEHMSRFSQDFHGSTIFVNYETEYIPRYPEYAASDDGKFKKIKDIMSE